jgi:hypothetical protein
MLMDRITFDNVRFVVAGPWTALRLYATALCGSINRVAATAEIEKEYYSISQLLADFCFLVCIKSVILSFRRNGPQ